jgi:hypothetical protein
MDSSHGDISIDSPSVVNSDVAVLDKGSASTGRKKDRDENTTMMAHYNIK